MKHMHRVTQAHCGTAELELRQHRDSGAGNEVFAIDGFHLPDVAAATQLHAPFKLGPNQQ